MAKKLVSSQKLIEWYEMGVTTQMDSPEKKVGRRIKARDRMILVPDHMFSEENKMLLLGR